MMYSEFVAGTGCKDNAHNYEVFKNLEVMYMNTEMSKADIYEYGKKLVDNSKSEEQLKIEAEVKAEIELLQKEFESNKWWLEVYENDMKFWETLDKEMYEMSKRSAKYYKEDNKRIRNRIAALKWVLR